MRVFVKILAIWVLLCLVGCGYNDFDPLKAENPDTPAINMTIEELKRFYVDGGKELSGNIVLCGQVISSDSTGNFYKSLIIEDNTGALELKIGLFDLYSIYPKGKLVHVNTNGLTLGRYYDRYVLGMGTPQDDFYETDYIPTPALADRHIVRSRQDGPLIPEVKTITQISDDDLCRLIVLNDMRFYQDSGVWSGERPLRDRSGKRIKIYTSSYATFANEPVPSGEFTVIGVLLKYKDDYQIVIRDLGDIKLSSEE